MCNCGGNKKKKLETEWLAIDSNAGEHYCDRCEEYTVHIDTLWARPTAKNKREHKMTRKCTDCDLASRITEDMWED